jgi:hypothetical protein
MNNQHTYYLPRGILAGKSNPIVLGALKDETDTVALLYATYMRHLGNNNPSHYSEGTSMFIRDNGAVVIRTVIDGTVKDT